MEQVKQTVERVMERGLSGDKLFTDLAKQWACYCLEHHQGELLDRGLNLAKALTSYEEGVLHPEVLP